MKRRTIEVDYLARVEGEGALYISIDGDRVDEVSLKIFEPPRFFEALLRGRAFTEAPDITARICGICPVAYQMSAVHALERALGVNIGPEVRALRRLLYCGEWIESHTLHVYMLHAPDLLGYDGAVEMARDHKAVVQRGLRLKKVGNRILQVVGGREIHPVNVLVGGFYRAPEREALEALLPELRWALHAAIETVRWVATLELPVIERDYVRVALRHPQEYPMNEGRVVSSEGLDIDASDWERHFEEEHVARSNALHARIRGGGNYLVGPLARLALNFDLLPTWIQDLAGEVGLPVVCRNPFQSIVTRSLEIVYACHEAIRIIEGYREPAAPSEPVLGAPSTGAAATEAPRGLLFHRYVLGEGGIIESANIVPPTSQNQATIEADLRAVVEAAWTLPDAELQHRCEHTIRTYDPCISCATHFLDFRVVRRG